MKNNKKVAKRECTHPMGCCCTPLKPSVIDCKHCGYFKVPVEVERFWDGEILMVRDRDGSVSIA
jgi:hypothetical protein